MLFHNISRSIAAIGLIAAITFIDLRVFGVNSATAAFTYLIAVLAAATRWGLVESMVTSAAGVLAYNFFFLPPVGTLTIAEPQNWIALVTFLITAVTASQLSASAKKQAREATNRQHEMEKLYQLSRALMLSDEQQSLASRVALQISQVFGIPEVVFCEHATGKFYRAGASNPAIPDGTIRESTATQGIAQIDERTAALPVSLGGQPIGNLIVHGSTLSAPALQAIANLAAIAIEKGRAQEVANRAEAERQNEQLKSTLLDALAHEFKTPLTSIKAATTAMLLRSNRPVDEIDLLTVVDEETDRMDLLVTESIEMARIQAGNVRPRVERFPVSEMIAVEIGRLRTALDERPVKTELPDELPYVHADSHLSGLVLRQLLNNALKYAPPNTPLTVTASTDEGFVTVSVTNEGTGIPEQEQKAIFEKFYRGREARERIPGSGLGLTIARQIVEAQGGRIWVRSNAEDGTSFSFSIPVEPYATEDRRSP